MSRILLEKIPALTFYKDAFTSAKRTRPIPQLACVGKPCDLYTPDVVRCTNIGGHGTEVDWKCEADLPESLRFGRVDVSCEGWSRSGDPYVLKGSCGLEYRLVQVPAILREGRTDDYDLRHPSKWFQPDTILSSIFATLWISVLLVILYKILRSCLRSRPHMPSDPPPRRPPYTPPGSRGSFPGDYYDDLQGPPPPYSKQPPYTSWLPWQPGFWTGTALGGLGTYLFNRGGHRQPSPPPHFPPPRRTPWFWDWERPRVATSTTYERSGSFMSTRRSTPSSDRGEGPSNLGSMRASTGFGGSSIR